MQLALGGILKHCFLILVISLSAAIAQAQFESLNGDPAVNANTSENLADLGSTTTTEPEEEIGDTTGSLIANNPQAGVAAGLIKGSRKANTAGQVSAVIGTGFAAACAASFGFNTACVAAVVSYAGAVKAFSQARKLNKQAQNLLEDSNSGLSEELEIDLAATAEAEASAAAGLAALESQGYVTSADGSSVTGPGGQTLSTAALQSARSLQAAGIPAAEAQAFESKLRELQANAENNTGGGGLGGSGRGSQLAGASGGFRFSGFGGGGRSISSEVSKGDAAVASAVGKKISTQDANAFSKNFLGTPIGVASGDVFGIVTKKYQTSDKKNTFFKREF